MDIGDEQSNSHVIQIAWSSPGLALHRRSVLAVLTANHILSLWASESNIKDQASWKRVAILKESSATGDSIQKPLNVRCMAWCPNDPRVDLRDSEEGSFFLAVGLGNSSKQTFFWIYEVINPYYDATTEWTALEVLELKTSKEPVKSASTSQLQREMQESAFPDFLGFSAALTNEFYALTVLTCRRGGVFNHYKIYFRPPDVVGGPLLIPTELTIDPPIDGSVASSVVWQNSIVGVLIKL